MPELLDHSDDRIEGVPGLLDHLISGVDLDWDILLEVSIMDPVFQTAP